MFIIVKPCWRHRSMFSWNSTLVWIAALSIIGVVGRRRVEIKWSIPATTTALVTVPSNTLEVNAHSRLTNPSTLSRLLLAQGTSMVSPRGCQAYGMQGVKVKPASSKYNKSICSCLACSISSDHGCWDCSNQSGSRFDRNDFRTRFQISPARWHTLLRVERLGVRPRWLHNSASTFLSDRGDWLIVRRASLSAAPITIRGRPLRGSSNKAQMPPSSHAGNQVDAVCRQTPSIPAIFESVNPVWLNTTTWARIRGRWHGWLLCIASKVCIASGDNGFTNSLVHNIRYVKMISLYLVVLMGFC